MSDTFLERTSSNSSNSQRIGTISVWLKRAKLGTTQYILANYIDGSNYGYFRFDSSDRLHYVNAVSGSHSTDIVTTRKFRDTFGWYNFCVSVDSTQGTSSNRVKIYVNGTQETAFDTGSYGSQNDSHRMWMASASGGHRMGSQQTTQSHFDGCMSHFHFIDGTAYAASSFGSTDSTTGEWKINTSPSVTYGNNGFFILKDGNSVTDQSGEGNNWSVGGGTLTKTEDCPSNVFATFNPLYNSGGTVTYSAGNTRFAESDNQWKTTFSTLGASSGKYYAEFKCNGNWMMVGAADYNETKPGTADRNFGSSTDISTQGYGIYNTDGNLYYRGSSTSYSASYTSGDIIGVGLDCDNNRIFFSKNGTWQNSADPTNASTGFSMNATDATYVFAASVQNDEIHANFGNGYFNTTAISSEGTNASGIGKFEYNVPTGYTALSTKGLNE